MKLIINLPISISLFALKTVDIIITHIIMSYGAPEGNLLYNPLTIILSYIACLIYLTLIIGNRKSKDTKWLLSLGIVMFIVLLFPVVWNTIGLFYIQNLYL